MNSPNNVGSTRTVVSTIKSNAVLGASMSYTSLKALESVILSDSKMNVLRDSEIRPNKTDLVKMSLIHFFKSSISKQKLLELYHSSNDEEIFVGEIK
jgi:hypothetical protein